MKWLTTLDQFGVQVQLKTHHGNEYYKTKIGGFLTVILYGLSLAYTLYVFIQWGEGAILPKISSSQKTIETLTLNVEDSQIMFDFIFFRNETPFSKTNNILMPVLMTYYKGTFQNYQGVFSDSASIPLPSRSLARSSTNETQLLLILTPCNATYDFGQTCADSATINETLQSFSAQLNLGIKLKQYDASQNSFEEIVKDSVQSVENAYILYNQIKLKTALTLHDTGILFEEYSSDVFISDVEVSPQLISKVSTQLQIPQFDPIFINLFRIGEIQTVITITDAKLGEILADISSIVSILLFISLMAIYYNEYQLEQDLIQEILLILYPNLKQVQLSKTFYGKVVQSKFDDQNIDTQQFKEKYEDIQKQGRNYLNLLQLIKRIIILEKKMQILSNEQQQQYNNNSKLSIIDTIFDRNSSPQINPSELTQEFNNNKDKFKMSYPLDNSEAIQIVPSDFGSHYESPHKHKVQFKNKKKVNLKHSINRVLESDQLSNDNNLKDLSIISQV